ncbi:hypothetical protein ACXKTX_36085 [Burkholderia gladioli]
MTSLTYTAWTNESMIHAFEKLDISLNEAGFTIINTESGMCHTWNESGERSLHNIDEIKALLSRNLTIGIQWWRDSDDIYVTLAPEQSVGGVTCYIRLVGLSRMEQADIARSIILHVIPDKQDFPDDWPVFKIDTQ